MKMSDVLNRLIERLQNPPIFVAPPNEKVVLTPARYARKTAFQIDPLLAASVQVENQLNPRCESEHDAGDLWKNRIGGAHGRRAWKPLFAVLLLVCTIAVRHSEQTFAAPAHSQVDVGKSDNGYHVTQVQYVLRSFGYSVKIDGDYGAQTERAVKHFQKVNGLTVDGVVGSQTLDALGLTLGSPVASVTRAQPATQGTPRARTPVPVADPTPTPTGQDGWHDLAISVGWTDDQWPTLSCIINRESRGRPGVKNPNSSATGLLQILASGFPGVNLYDPTTNLTVGLQMFNSRGWQPWTLPGHQC